MKSWLWVALLVAGCGTDPPANPLVGSWKGTVGGGTLSLIVKSDGKYDETLASDDASSGCKSDLSFTGTWSSTATTISATPSSGHLTITSCTMTSDNADRDTTTMENGAYTVTNVAYTIVGTELTMTMGGQPITLTRQ